MAAARRRAAGAATLASRAGGASTSRSAERVAARSSPAERYRRPGSLASARVRTVSSSFGQVGARLARRGRLLVHVRPQERDVGRARERRLPGQALVEDAAERVDVGALVERVAGDLLGRDVLERADDLARDRDARERAGALGEPEVAEVAVLASGGLGDEDVRGLDVAVDRGPSRARRRGPRRSGRGARRRASARVLRPRRRPWPDRSPRRSASRGRAGRPRLRPGRSG